MSNEAELCEALMRLLEIEAGATRHDVSFPEKDGSGPPVEVRFRLGDRRVAIEHTLVEPFPGAIQTGKEFVELTTEIESRFHGNMPGPGTYSLTFPIHPTSGQHRRKHAQLRIAIAAWIEAAARELHEECPERRDRNRCPHGYSGTRRTEIDGVPLQLSLRVHWSDSSRHDGSLFLSRVVGSDIEDKRLTRMRTALAKKLPKLADCSADGDVTMLILEWSDISLSNHVNVARALEAALEERNDWPDYVFLADTATEQWHFFQPVIARKFSIEMDYIEIERQGSAQRIE